MANFIPVSAIEERHDRIRRHLKERSLKALLITNPDNFYYASGFFLDVAPWERPVAAVIPARGEPFMVMNSLSTNHLRMSRERGTLAIEKVHIYSEHPRVTGRTWLVPQWSRMLIHCLEEAGIGRGTVAVDAPSAPVREAVDSCPALEMVIDPIITHMRLVKDSHELDLIRRAGELTDFGQRVFMQAVEPGRTMTDVDLEVARAINAEAARQHPRDRVETRCFSLSGPMSAAPHGTGADVGAVIESGHGIVNIIIVRFNGYVCENERTWIVGMPSDEQARAHRAATRATRAATGAMVEGEPLAECDARAQQVFEEEGLAPHILHRTGHGIGIAGHEEPADMAFNPRPLMAGEVLSAEPGIYIYGLGGFRHDDTVIVGPEGPESRDFERYPRPVDRVRSRTAGSAGARQGSTGSRSEVASRRRSRASRTAAQRTESRSPG